MPKLMCYMNVQSTTRHCVFACVYVYAAATVCKECEVLSLSLIICLSFCRSASVQVVYAPIDVSSEAWQDVSDDAKYLVKRLLCRDVLKRWTAARALQHPWIQSGGEISGRGGLKPPVSSVTSVSSPAVINHN